MERYALKELVEDAFRKWKSYLNKNYVQKGKTLFNELRKITPRQWDEFVAMKTFEESMALSAHHTKMAKKNVHPQHLGTDGYYVKDDLFRKIEEEDKADRTYMMEWV